MRTIGDKKIPSKGGRTRARSERDRARNHGRVKFLPLLLLPLRIPNCLALFKYCKGLKEVNDQMKSKAPVSQLVNADDTSVIEIKTQLYLES